jgi:YVTN family beta-propeller protein
MFLDRKQMVGLAGVLLCVGLMSKAEPAPGEHSLTILDRWHLGGPDAWDYLMLDSSGQRLFVTRGTRVEVVDTRSGKLVGTIPNTNGVHGIALAEDLNRGYSSNGKADSVTVFDLATLKTIKEAPVHGKNPDAIIYDPKSKHLFSFNGHSNDVTVLDANSLALVATIKTPAKPEFAVSDGDGKLFDNIEMMTGR